MWLLCCCSVASVMGCLRCLSVIASDLDNEQAPQLVQVRLQCGHMCWLQLQHSFAVALAAA